MPYHQGLTRAQGDPGFFSFLGKGIRTVAGLLPGPVGTVARLIPSGTRRPQLPVRLGPTPFPSTRGTGPEAMRAQERAAGLPSGTLCPKRRRKIDPLNMRALRRANSRQKSFLRAVDATLKNMPTKGQVASRRKKIAGAVRRRG